MILSLKNKTLGKTVPWLLNALFPSLCPLCQQPTIPHTLCVQCEFELPPQPENHCLRCGSWRVEVREGCEVCLNKTDMADAVYFAYLYDGIMEKLVKGFKFADRSEWAMLLGNLFWQRLQGTLHWESPDSVIPVPLHINRLIRRQYNQSALLARSLSVFLNRPLVTNGLKRIKMTTPQTQLDSVGRLENVRGAFWADKNRVQGRSLLLVDDVFTTGATTRAAVEALKQAGASRVAVACLTATQPGRKHKKVALGDLDA